MAALTDVQLSTEAQAIATATEAGSNTAAVIGQMIQDLVDSKVNISDGIKVAKVTLNSAQILALNTTPITLVAAQGAGTFINVLSVAKRLNYNSAAYTTNTTLRIGIGSFTPFVTDSTTLLTQTANAFEITSPIQSTLVGGAVDWANAPLRVSVPVGNPVAGNSSLDIWVTYNVLTLS